MMEVWYSPAEIRYSWEQCWWMIVNILPLDYGQWLPEPQETGYTGESHDIGLFAPYETVCCVVGELRVRLQRTGTDGKLLIAQLQAEKGWELAHEAKMALAYCCGWRRKQQNYKDWRWQKEKRREMKGFSLQRS